jgi:hypothetical protein
MGNTIWVDVRGRSKDDELQDNSIMLRLEKELDRLATKLNVAKLSEFHDYSELEAAYGEFDDEGNESADEGLSDNDSQATGDWFDPGAALTSVIAIHNHLVQHPEDLGFVADPPRAHWPGQLMNELIHCRSVLEKAVSEGKQFRFLIVP